MVDADVIDYENMICRSPPIKGSFINTDDSVSVPFSIGFNDNYSMKPWTRDFHRFRFYKQPQTLVAVPQEINVSKKTEIYVKISKGEKFMQRKSHEEFNSICSGSNRSSW